MVREIWNSYSSLPIWVQVWVGVILVPVHAAAIFFLDQPNGALLAALAIGGMIPNAVLLVIERGFSRAMAFSHIFIWGPMLFVIRDILNSAGPYSQSFLTYIWVLLTVTVVSLAFDFGDAWKWWRGDRAVAGK